MKKRRNKALIILAGVSSLCIAVSCSALANDSKYSKNKLELLGQYIQKAYFGKEDEKEMQENIYNGFVNAVDNPVTYYLDKDQYEIEMAAKEGYYIGIGITGMWMPVGQGITVVDVLKDSAADQAGVKVGDRIMQIDDIKAIQINASDIMVKLGEAQKKKVSYIIEDGKTGKQKKVELSASKVKYEELESKTMGDVAYLQIKHINPGTSETIKNVIEENKTARGVILDIRDLYTDNQEEITKIASLFLNNKTAFKLQDKGQKMQTITVGDNLYTGPLVVLIDNDTKGAAELLAAALKERATLLGRQTKGLGWHTEIKALDDGTGIRVAVGKYYAPDGQDLTKEGVKPNEVIATTQKGLIDLVDNGKISEANDAVLQAALKKLK